MKGIVRDPILVVVLGIITCGFYSLYWMYCVREETRNYLEDASISPALELLLTIVCFPFILVWYYRMSRDLMRMQEKSGRTINDQTMLFMILAFFGVGIANNYIIQDELNKVWKSDTDITA